MTTALNSEAAEELPILQKLEMKKSFAENDRIAAEIYPKYYERGSDGMYFLPKYEPHPILQCREEILQKYEQNKVLVITGETGSGKSTQVPQYILDDSVLKNKHAKIFVTQPRRIAAQTIAERVAENRVGWDKVGVGLVGYHVGLDRNVGRDSRIIYMTPGIVSNKMQSDRMLQENFAYHINRVIEIGI